MNKVIRLCDAHALLMKEPNFRCPDCVYGSTSASNGTVYDQEWAKNFTEKCEAIYPTFKTKKRVIGNINL